MKNPPRFAVVGLITGALMLAACDGAGSFTGTGNIGGPGGGGGGGVGGGGTSGEPAVVFAPDHFSGYGEAKIAGDSRKLVFTDDSDPLGTNPDEDWQVWSLDLATQELLQLTSFIQFEFGANSTIDISANGEYVVFVSDSDIGGTNPGNLPSIFRAATDGSVIDQVIGINLPGANVTEPNISGDGSTIVFLSANDLTGDNPGLEWQIFAIDATGANLRQVTSQAPLNPRNLSFSDNGLTIAMESFADPFNLNADIDWEIFVIDIDGSNLRQITVSDPTPGGGRRSHAPRLSDDGSLVAFTSDADHSPGGNTDPNFEVYVAPTNGGAITQISSSDDTDVGLDEGNIVGGFEISGDGRYVVFGTTANLAGGNSNLDYTLFWASTAGGASVQLLRPGTIADSADDRDASLPSINDNGSTVSFVSIHNLTSVAQPGGDKIYTIARQ